MPRLLKTRNSRTPARMFETRSEAWAAVGLETQINRHEAQRSLRRLPVQLLLLIAVIWGESIARSVRRSATSLTPCRDRHTGS